MDYFAGTTELGLYSLSANLSQLIWILPQSIATVIMPFIASDSRGLLDKTLSVGRITFFATFLLSIVLVLFSEIFIVTVYGETFRKSAHIFVILLVGVIPYCLSFIYASYLTGINRQKINMYASIVGLIGTVVFDLLLIPEYGGKGAAIATVISYFLTTLFVLIRLSVISNKSLANLIFIKREDLILILNLFKSKFN